MYKKTNRKPKMSKQSPTNLKKVVPVYVLINDGKYNTGKFLEQIKDLNTMVVHEWKKLQNWQRKDYFVEISED